MNLFNWKSKKILQGKPTVKQEFVLLRGISGNVFWTTDDGSDHQKEGFTILYRSYDSDDMIKEWRKYNNQLNLI